MHGALGRRLPGAARRLPRAPADVLRRTSQQMQQRDAPTTLQVAVPAGTAVAYENVDGMRVDDGRYTRFKQEMREIVGEKNVVDDPVRTFAFGTDASFYRLNPQVVVKVKSEQEVVETLAVARAHETPVTFRAAGTSLSGQAITDSVLMKISHNGTAWRKHKILDGGKRIQVEPALIGGEVNRLLAGYAKKNKMPTQYKIGPDPASIDSCMIGGIVANNSSGMCCGVKQNTYHTLQDMRVVLVDGTVLDTADEASRAAFRASHAGLLRGLSELAARVQADAPLMELINKKYAIKNTTGYAINALADFAPDEPIEVLKRLMIGSEGTLGFVSRVTYHTVPDHPFKASAFLVFPDIGDACDATTILREKTNVDAVEIFDRRSLKLCAEMEPLVALCPEIRTLPAAEEGAALLIECRGEDEAALAAAIGEVTGALDGAGVPVVVRDTLRADFDAEWCRGAFRHDPKESGVYWDARKGLIPIVGGAREPGSSMLLEDVACETHRLGDMSRDIIQIFRKYDYHDACLMGHALEGNLHLIFNQSFKDDAEMARYEGIMQDLCETVALKYGGSLKAEHGTGRNVAPFVEMEWGSKAYGIMWEVKRLFDPAFLLNPGVILNDDPDVHAKNIRIDATANPLIDRCISCGWCESNCPSRDLSLTPRQRIQVYKEMTKMREEWSASGERFKSERLLAFEASWGYVENTCAADGMCQEKCPVKINTGELIKSLRADALEGIASSDEPKPRGAAVAAWLASNFGATMALVPPLLNVVSLVHLAIGSSPMGAIAQTAWGVGNNYVPLWNKYMPQGAHDLRPPMPADPPSVEAEKPKRKRVVYLPSCVTRSMGPARGDDDANGEAVHAKFLSLLDKAGYEAVLPPDLSSQCCGMIFDSRGYRDVGASQSTSLEAALLEASEDGKLPIVCDTSPCLQRMKEKFESPLLKFAMYEPVQFISLYLQKELDFSKVRETVAVHVPCSSKKLKLGEQMVQLAELCATDVHATPIPCCGMAGDRGMRYPELTGSSLQHLSLPESCTDGYSTSRTCEMSLSNHSGMHFRSLLYLVDEATKPKAPKAAGAATASSSR